MDTTSPEANMYLSILERIRTQVPEIRYIEQDFGQLENFTLRPAVSWPCALIDIDDLDFTDIGGNNRQEAKCYVYIRIAAVAWSTSSNLTPDAIRGNALLYYALEQKIYQALHGWRAPGFSKLLRRKSKKEIREDEVRVRILVFETSFEDDTASPVRQLIANKQPEILPG